MQTNNSGGTSSSSSETIRTTIDESRNNSMNSRQSGTANNIAAVFQYHRWEKIDRKRIPSLRNRNPLALFFHADEKLNVGAKKLKQIQNQGTVRFKRCLDNVHRLQKVVLDTIYIVYFRIPSEFKSSRDYRLLLPAQDQGELDGCFSENIMFAAEAIAAGFRIRGLHNYSDTLKQTARTLCAAFETLRFVFREQAINGVGGGDIESSFPQLFGILRDFDWAWTRFEQQMCFSFFSIPYTQDTAENLISAFRNSIEEQESFAVLLSETVIRSLEHGLIDSAHIQNFEPFVVIALPRLALFNCINDNSLEYFDSFGASHSQLSNIKNEMERLTKNDKQILEKILVESVKPGSEHCDNVSDNDEHIKKVLKSIAAITDRLQCGDRAKDFARILYLVFKMHQDISIEVETLDFEHARRQAWRSNESFPPS